MHLNRALLTTFFLALSSSILTVSADKHVDVGKNGLLKFDPETIYANPGENVYFHFHGDHSATESTARLGDPCHPLGGFDTGVLYGESSVI